MFRARLVKRLSPIGLRSFGVSKARFNGQPAVNPHRAFYQNFGFPLVKVLSITFGTYYGLMYLWEYLETESKTGNSSIELTDNAVGSASQATNHK